VLWSPTVCSFALNFTTLSVFHFYFECLSIYSSFFYALPLNILLSVTFLQYSSGSTHFFSFRFRLFSASFFSSLSLLSLSYCLVLVAIVFWTRDVVLLNTISGRSVAFLSKSPSVWSLILVSTVSLPSFIILLSRSSGVLAPSIHHHMSQFWRGPSRASPLMNVSASWIFHTPCSCLLNDSANSKAHWLKFHFILLDVFLFFLFAQDGGLFVCLSSLFMRERAKDCEEPILYFNFDAWIVLCECLCVSLMIVYCTVFQLVLLFLLCWFVLCLFSPAVLASRDTDTPLQHFLYQRDRESECRRTSARLFCLFFLTHSSFSSRIFHSPYCLLESCFCCLSVFWFTCFLVVSG